MIPNNIHAIVATALPLDPIIVTRFKARVTDERGRWVNEYYDAESGKGNVQPVSYRTRKELGLDSTKYYVQLWTDEQLYPAQEGRGADQVVYAGRTYEVVGDDEDWKRQDGWSVYYMVEVKP